MNNRFFLFILLTVLTTMTGCAGLGVRPEKSVSPEAAVLIDRVKIFNARLNACKGIGTISIKSTRIMPRMRFAWLCDLPDRIRLELLAPTGTPLLTISADGTYFYYQPHNAENKVLKKKAKNINLGKIIGAPLTIDDTCHLLAGAIPLHEFDTAKRIDLPDENVMLQFRSYRPDRVENIFFDKTTRQPAGIDVFHGRNRDPEYSVRFNGTRQINGATIPESIRIENEKGETVTIIIRRFWPASDIEAEKFILTAPS